MLIESCQHNFGLCNGFEDCYLLAPVVVLQINGHESVFVQNTVCIYPKL